jgi:hypothetical protein
MRPHQQHGGAGVETSALHGMMQQQPAKNNQLQMKDLCYYKKSGYSCLLRRKPSSYYVYDVCLYGVMKRSDVKTSQLYTGATPGVVEEKTVERPDAECG